MQAGREKSPASLDTPPRTQEMVLEVKHTLVWSEMVLEVKHTFPELLGDEWHVFGHHFWCLRLGLVLKKHVLFEVQKHSKINFPGSDFYAHYNASTGFPQKYDK